MGKSGFFSESLWDTWEYNIAVQIFLIFDSHFKMDSNGSLTILCELDNILIKLQDKGYEGNSVWLPENQKFSIFCSFKLSDCRLNKNGNNSRQLQNRNRKLYNIFFLYVSKSPSVEGLKLTQLLKLSSHVFSGVTTTKLAFLVIEERA